MEGLARFGEAHAPRGAGRLIIRDHYLRTLTKKYAGKTSRWVKLDVTVRRGNAADEPTNGRIYRVSRKAIPNTRLCTGEA